MAPENERLARVEARQDTQEQTNTAVIRRLDSIDGKISAIAEQLASNKGFLRGVIFTVTAIGGVIGAAFAELYNHFSTR